MAEETARERTNLQSKRYVWCGKWMKIPNKQPTKTNNERTNENGRSRQKEKTNWKMDYHIMLSNYWNCFLFMVYFHSQACFSYRFRLLSIFVFVRVYFVSVTWSSFSFLCSSFFFAGNLSLYLSQFVNSIAIHIGHYASTWNKLICFFYPKQIWYFGNRRLEY